MHCKLGNGARKRTKVERGMWTSMLQHQILSLCPKSFSKLYIKSVIKKFLATRYGCGLPEIISR